MSLVTRQIARLAAAGVWTPQQRSRLLRAAGARIGRARVYAGIRFIAEPSWLTVGDGTFINAELLVGANADVTIGANASLGPRCALLPSTHEAGTADKRAGATSASPIMIGDGCWLGAGVTVLSGVSIGAGCVVAAGAVVTSDCEPNSLYGGVPARKIRDFDETAGG
ncbi:acyltransferase [Microbacterium pumilum]|uniref:Acetyltransferase n=1 Tax=Microbacterium pumilum TaxID=344165 RepID=A0ABN2S9A4_9MICO